MTRFMDIIPLPHTRVPLTPHSLFHDLFPPILCHYVTAVLVLIPNTFHLRLALLPVSLWLSFRGATRVDLAPGQDNEKLVYVNQGLVVRILTYNFPSERLTIYTDNPYHSCHA